ncbi:MAG: PDZ domain-containing protein [Verrucomicrobiales bacterium]
MKLQEIMIAATVFALAASVAPAAQDEAAGESAESAEAAAAAAAAAIATPAKEVVVSGALNSVVRVNVTRQAYNFYQPWQKMTPNSRRGLGAVIAGNRVLVTGEMVANATYIELEKADSGSKATARVVAFDYEANIALLEPTEEHSEFLNDMDPLQLDTSVKPGDSIDVWQVEDNGTPVSTSINVTKVETSPSFLDVASFLVYEATGPIQYRAGSFTVPVVRDGKLVGLLLNYTPKELVSNVLAAPIIESFLKDEADGQYDGFPELGIRVAKTLDEQFRNYLKLGDGEGGIYVSRVVRGSSAANAGLKEGDVILGIDGHQIDSRGNYDDPLYGKLALGHLVRGNAKMGQKIQLDILRDGERQELDVELIRRKPEDYLIQPYMIDRGPKFLIEGGLVFQELTRDYLKLYGDSWTTRAPIKFLLALTAPEELEDQGVEKIVFLSRVVPTPATVGYEQVNNIRVTKVNGNDIKNIADLAAALEQPLDGHHRIEFDEFPYLIFLDPSLSKGINAQLKQRIGTTERLD